MEREDDVRTYCNSAKIHSKKKEYEDALQEYDRAIEVDPEYAEAYYGRGITYINIGYPEEAILDLDHALLLDPNNAKFYRALATAYFRKGDYKTFTQNIDKAREIEAE